MTDALTPERRSWNMSRIRGRDTGPERTVRSLLHTMGYRFTVNGPLNKSLPGKPDIVLPRYRTVVFVHGCFWHHHRNCANAKIPKTRTAWWREKLTGNARRDRRCRDRLRAEGWAVLVVWECVLKKDPTKVAARLDRHLSAPD
jgi:DNA mismatch endonuclease (patch repair protein)